MAVHAIEKVDESYKEDQKPAKAHSFHLLCAMVYPRNMSVNIDHVSQATFAGRMKILLIVSGMKQDRVK
jgi:hypothetical protein